MAKHCRSFASSLFILLNYNLHNKRSNQIYPLIYVDRYFGGSHKISTFTYDNNQHLHINVIFIALKSLVKQNSLLASYTYHLESSLICKIHSMDLAKPGRSSLKQHLGENSVGLQLFFTYMPALTLNFLHTSWAKEIFVLKNSKIEWQKVVNSLQNITLKYFSTTTVCRPAENLKNLRQKYTNSDQILIRPAFGLSEKE